MPTLAINKKARFDYEILEEFEGGLVLSGAEVKAAKAGHMQLKGSFLDVRNEEMWLKNAFIGKYQPAGKQEDYDPNRDRKVLVHKAEIKRLLGKKTQEGLTIVPILCYTKRNLVKLKFALARGKKKHEKRDSIKKRDVDRAIRERVKGNKNADF